MIVLHMLVKVDCIRRAYESEIISQLNIILYFKAYKDSLQGLQ